MPALHVVKCDIPSDDPGADPGIYVSGGALDRRGVWGPPRSSGGPGQRPVGGPRGRSPPEAHEN